MDGVGEVREDCLLPLQEDPRVLSPKISIPGVFVGLVSVETSGGALKLSYWQWQCLKGVDVTVRVSVG